MLQLEHGIQPLWAEGGTYVVSLNRIQLAWQRSRKVWVYIYDKLIGCVIRIPNDGGKRQYSSEWKTLPPCRGRRQGQGRLCITRCFWILSNNHAIRRNCFSGRNMKLIQRNTSSSVVKEITPNPIRFRSRVYACKTFQIKFCIKIKTTKYSIKHWKLEWTETSETPSSTALKRLMPIGMNINNMLCYQTHGEPRNIGFGLKVFLVFSLCVKWAYRSASKYIYSGKNTPNRETKRTSHLVC